VIQPITHGGWYIYGFVVILFGLPVGIDALSRWPSTYHRAGLRKWPWALAALLSNLLLLGPFFAAVYLVTARRMIAATKPRRPRPTSTDHDKPPASPYGSDPEQWGSTSPRSSSSTWQPESWATPKPQTESQRTPCGRCLTTGWVTEDGRTVPCTACGGRGYWN
jgi:hypothetical protein